MPLIYLTALLPIGNPMIGVFYAAVVAGSFFYGYLRLASGSLWSSIAHATHNSAWGIMVGFTATSSPLLVNGYLLEDIGIVITTPQCLFSLAAAVLVVPVLATLLRSGTSLAGASGRKDLSRGLRCQERPAPLRGQSGGQLVRPKHVSRLDGRDERR